MAEPRNLDGRRRPFRKPKERSSTLGLIHHPTIGRADSANGDGWEVAVFFFLNCHGSGAPHCHYQGKLLLKLGLVKITSQWQGIGTRW
jgi:hypothetical protein